MTCAVIYITNILDECQPVLQAFALGITLKLGVSRPLLPIKGLQGHLVWVALSSHASGDAFV